MIEVDENNCVDIDGYKVTLETLISEHKYRKDDKNRLREFGIILFSSTMMGKGMSPDHIAKEAIKQADAIVKYL